MMGNNIVVSMDSIHKKYIVQKLRHMHYKEFLLISIVENLLLLPDHRAAGNLHYLLLWGY